MNVMYVFKIASDGNLKNLKFSMSHVLCVLPCLLIHFHVNKRPASYELCQSQGKGNAYSRQYAILESKSLIELRKPRESCELDGFLILTISENKFQVCKSY